MIIHLKVLLFIMSSFIDAANFGGGGWWAAGATIGRALHLKPLSVLRMVTQSHNNNINQTLLCRVAP